jgi:predicted phosphodiesterase
MLTTLNSVHIVRGDLDTASGLSELPETKVVKIGQFNIGLCHGHQVCSVPHSHHISTHSNALTLYTR